MQLVTSSSSPPAAHHLLVLLMHCAQVTSALLLCSLVALRFSLTFSFLGTMALAPLLLFCVGFFITGLLRLLTGWMVVVAFVVLCACAANAAMSIVVRGRDPAIACADFETEAYRLCCAAVTAFTGWVRQGRTTQAMHAVRDRCVGLVRLGAAVVLRYFLSCAKCIDADLHSAVQCLLITTVLQTSAMVSVLSLSSCQSLLAYVLALLFTLLAMPVFARQRSTRWTTLSFAASFIVAFSMGLAHATPPASQPLPSHPAPPATPPPATPPPATPPTAAFVEGLPAVDDLILIPMRLGAGLLLLLTLLCCLAPCLLLSWALKRLSWALAPAVLASAAHAPAALAPVGTCFGQFLGFLVTCALRMPTPRRRQAPPPIHPPMHNRLGLLLAVGLGVAGLARRWPREATD